MIPGNAQAIAAWNTVLFDKFVQFRHLLVEGVAIYGDRALELYPPRAGWSVVDIGCGFGDTTIEIGRRVGPAGRAMGVDAAANFIAVAKTEAAAARVDNVHFAVADVEEEVPGGPYDLAYSRLGTMFFNNPVFALRNTRKALSKGGRLVMSVWRRKDANECFDLPELAVREILGDPRTGDQVTCGPGPFSMSSPDVTGDQLHAAGFVDIAFHRYDAAIKIGENLDEAVRLALTLGPAGEVVRLAGELAIEKRAQIETAVRRVVERWMRTDGTVWGPSSAWIATAAT